MLAKERLDASQAGCQAGHLPGLIGSGGGGALTRHGVGGETTPARGEAGVGRWVTAMAGNLANRIASIVGTGASGS